MTAELRRGVFLAVLGLLIGLGLVAAVFGGLDRWRHAHAPAPEPAPGAVGALTPGPAPVPDMVPPPAARAAAPAAPDALKFDIVRVEPNGESVVAGRGAPNTVVELLVDGKAVAKALADPNGQFAIVPPALPAGNSEIVLRSTNAEGRETRSTESVAVAVSPTRTEKPLVALTAPDKPTVVLSQPEVRTAQRAPDPAPGQAVAGRDTPVKGAAKGPAAKDAAAKPSSGKAAKDAPAPVKIVSVDAQEGGRLFVTSQAAPGATVRLYLNDTLIAPASVGADGKVTFTIGRGVKPGAYTVRVDQVDSVSGKVRSRAEVPFSVPEPARVATNLAPSRPGAAADKPVERPVAPAARAEAVSPTPAAIEPPRAGVFVPAVSTAKIIRGDSLWQISRRTYGAGDRYTVIYDANQEQIRNPDLIYPGQIFVLPGDGKDAKAGRNG
ncbi:LysM peptidoglycan-binding domain-containing protein [Methylobacterium sp. E-041]|uniref:LysM peptidoglycan-binding domain-containing protein n=1 Tax=Methylobacterium sp. E-041 TaxID=2836573 RepID=UPI001FBA381B|nr:LysM peptidoglycan-binding domain-containing protein [Methylobacterium sp. E-041]MCJ2105091.1 LysM peptidoglycan-binding domain-containing protein [Methylobacterium sp. E-041]